MYTVGNDEVFPGRSFFDSSDYLTGLRELFSAAMLDPLGHQACTKLTTQSETIGIKQALCL